MRLMILRKSTWSFGEPDRSKWRTFQAGDVLTVPGDLTETQGDALVNGGYARYDAQAQVDPPASVKQDAPANKAVAAAPENKEATQPPLAVNLEELTRKELLQLARTRNITIIDPHASKEALKELIKKSTTGGKVDA